MKTEPYINIRQLLQKIQYEEKDILKINGL